MKLEFPLVIGRLNQTGSLIASGAWAVMVNELSVFVRIWVSF
jgi:hypothetical protein